MNDVSLCHRDEKFKINGQVIIYLFTKVFILMSAKQTVYLQLLILYLQ